MRQKILLFQVEWFRSLKENGARIKVISYAFNEQQAKRLRVLTDAPLCVQIADIYLNRAVGY